MSLFTRLRRSLHSAVVPPDDQTDCLAAFTTAEVITAAAALDRGNQAPADALVKRTPQAHRRCMAFAILQHVGS
jgi:hypothetical protein